MPDFKSLATLLDKYFPGELSDSQISQFQLAFEAYVEWNAKINVISRKDMENLAERHFLHALSIAKVIRFVPGTSLLDVGTGGGFPGIPLAILFPEAKFHLVDSKAKKIKVVEEVVNACGLKNVQFSIQRAEEMKAQYDFVLSRAVAPWEQFIPWTRKRTHCRNRNELKNGILYLRGMEIEEVKDGGHWKAYPLSAFFEEVFFSTKYLVHLSFCN